MSEQKIQTQITNWLEAKGCKVVKVVSATKSGNADLVCCYRGLYVEIEVKDIGEKARPLQLLKADETVKAGGYWQEASSLSQVMEFIHIIDLKEGFINGSQD